MPSDGGVLAAVLARGVAPAGCVLAVDSDAAAVSECAAQPRPGRLGSLHCVRAEPTTAPLGRGCVDVAASLFTLAHCADPTAVLASAAGALRSSGRLAMAAWSLAAAAPHLAVVEAALRRVAAADTDRLARALSLGEPGVLEALATRAGVRGTRVLRLRDVARFDGIDHLLAAVAPQLDASAAAHVEIRGEVGAALAGYTASDGTLLLPVEAAVLVRGELSLPSGS